MKFKIEHGIPTPRSPRDSTGLAEAMVKMEVGDSMEIPAQMRTNAYGIARWNGMKISIRKNPETGNIRAWRIA